MKTLEEMCAYSQQNWRDKLFRYQRPNTEFLRQTLLDNTLYFSAPSTFDDECDCRIAINSESPRILKFLALRGLVRQRNPYWRPDQVQREIIRLLQNFEERAEQGGVDTQAVSDTIGVLCLTERIDNMHMWTNYAAEQTGVCLVFSTKLDDPPLYPIYKVYYEDTLPTYNPFLVDSDGQLLEIFITKTKEWQSEEEWRVWEETLGPGSHPFDPAQLEGLIFGSKATDDFIAEIIAINNQREQPLNLVRAVDDDDGNTIDIAPL